MGIYHKYVLPRLIDFVMEDKYLSPLREKLLSQTKGIVAEIGFGAGANLPFYPKNIEKLYAVDNHPDILKRAKKKILAAPFLVETVLASISHVPLEKQSVDFVVSTFTLCSVQNSIDVLREVKRILKPRGEFLFLEHGLAPDKKIQLWQNRLTPIQKKIGGGCHLNRNILGLLADGCWDVTQQKRFYVEGIPKIFGFVSMGNAESGF